MTIDKPIFILGVQRSGTTWLAGALSKHPDIANLHEPRHIWSWGNLHKPDDVLTAEDCTPQIKAHVDKRLAEALDKLGGARVCDKTPSNCLRIPFLKALFPDAKIILLVRDGRAVFRSTREVVSENKDYGLTLDNITRRAKEVPIQEWHLLLLPRLRSIVRRLGGRPVQFWGVRPPGWKRWVEEDSSDVVLAKQWVAATRIALDEGRKLPPKNYLEVRYEDLMSGSEDKLNELIQFLEIENPEPIEAYIARTADSSRGEKWRGELDEEVLEEIRATMEPTLSYLGYTW